MMSNKLPKAVWMPVLALSLIIFGWRLNSVPLTNWDEGIYANVNLELFHGHDFTKLTYFGANFLEKPPLQFWLTFVLFNIFGATELAVRLIPALAGVATALLLSLWVFQTTPGATPPPISNNPRRRDLFEGLGEALGGVGRKWLALLAGIIFILGRFILVHAFRTGDLDGLLTFFIVLALYGYWRSPRQTRRWIILWGAASAGAIMTKSVAGLLPLIIVGIDILLTRGWRKIGWLNIVWATGVLIVLSAPWHIIETVRFGHAFWDSYLGKQVVDRTNESLFTATPWHYYFGIIRDRFAPFSFFLPLALLMSIWRAWKQKSGIDRLLIIWIVVTFVIFSYIKTRREWYILPLYPAAAMLLAMTFVTWWRERQALWMKALIIVSAIGAMGHFLTDNYIKLVLGHFPVLRTLTVTFWRTIVGQLLFGIVAVGLLAVVVLIKKNNWWRWWLGLCGGVIMAVAFVASLLYIHALPKTLPLKTIAARIEQEKVNNISLIGTALKKQPAGYFYILRMKIQSIEYPAGTAPMTPVVVTTNEDKNAGTVGQGNVLLKIKPLVLLDRR